MTTMMVVMEKRKLGFAYHHVITMAMGPPLFQTG